MADQTKKHDQWIRRAGLHLISSDGKRDFDLSELRFTFRTTQSDFETPNRAEIRVYNLKRESEALAAKEFDYVILEAGYEDNAKYGVIYQGYIKQFRRGRESMTDTYFDILSSDGDTAYIFAAMHETIGAGASQSDINKAALKSLQEHDPRLLAGYQQFQNFGGVLPRGKVMYGMTRNVLRDNARTTITSWSIQNGKLTNIPMEGYRPGDEIVLNSYTGMIGTPESTDEGVFVRALLNPGIQIGQLIKIDNKSINQTFGQKPNAVFQWDTWGSPAYLPDEAADGVYRVYVAEHVGDTRGNDWYTEMTCLAANKSSPAGESVRRF